MAGLFDDEPPTTEFDDLLAAGAVEHKQTDNASASAISEPNLPKAQSTVSGKAHQLKARSKVEVVRCRGIKRPPQTSLDQIDYSTLLAEARAGKPAAREQTAATKISHDGPANKRRGIESHTGPRQQSQPRGKATNHASRSKAGVRRGAQAPTGKGNKNWMENRRRKQAAAGAKADGDSQPLRRGLADDDVIDRTLLVHGASDSDGSDDDHEDVHPTDKTLAEASAAQPAQPIISREPTRSSQSQQPPRPSKLSKVPCRFWANGNCRKGEDCEFSHEGEPTKKAELCMFIVKGACLKGAKCVYSHDMGTVPCVFFHTGVCTDKNCPYSHAPLTDDSRKVLEERAERRRAAATAASNQSNETLCGAEQQPAGQSTNEIEPSLNEPIMGGALHHLFTSSNNHEPMEGKISIFQPIAPLTPLPGGALHSLLFDNPP